jgi:hypothetical protein
LETRDGDAARPAIVLAAEESYTYDVCMQDKMPRKQRMIRKQVFITPEQDRRLKERAALSGVAEARLIREGIDMVLEKQRPEDDDWKVGLLRIAGMWKDYDEIDEIIARRRARRRDRRKRLRLSGGDET